jgi:hypothetical protein
MTLYKSIFHDAWKHLDTFQMNLMSMKHLKSFKNI